MKTPAIFENSRSKYAVIGVATVSACVCLYLFGLLFIQTIMLVAYAASFPIIISLEKDRRNRGELPSPDEDEQWSKTKKKLDQIEDCIAKTEKRNERQTLIRQKIELQNELRVLEWKIRETEMNQIYNVSRGKMKPLSDLSSEMEEQQEQEKFLDRSVILEIVRNAEFILYNEPRSSMQIAMQPLERDLKVHFNALKKKYTRDSKNELLSDYWITWMLLNCIINGVQFNLSFVKYTSHEFRSKIARLVRAAEEFGLAPPLSSGNVIGSESPQFKDIRNI